MQLHCIKQPLLKMLDVHCWLELLVEIVFGSLNRHKLCVLAA